MDNPSFGDSPTVQSLLEKIASSALEPYAVRVAREQAARQGGATEQPGGPLDASSPGRGPGGVMRPISPTWQGRASASPAVKPETPGDEFAAFLHDHSVNSSTASGKQVEEDDDDHDDDERDDLARLPAAPKPSPRSLRGALAEQGDVAGVYDAILHDRWDSHTYAEAFKDLAKAIDVASRKNSSQFSAEIFRILLNFSICCTLRAQLALLQGMQADDRQPCRRSFEIASTYLEDFQKHVSSMQAHVVELCQSQAATARLWQLARQKQRENDNRESEGGRNSPMRRKATARPKTKGAPNGHRPPVQENGRGSNRGTAPLDDAGTQGGAAP